jgi:hypothetical protein
MKKIPTMFERDWNGDRSRVVNQIVPEAKWVVGGEGVATRKYDGTCCLVREGKLYKRHEVKKGKAEPADFEQIDSDQETGKRIGWVPVGGGPEDKWHREAMTDWPIADGTYELLGPKVQGNPEHFESYTLLRHADAERLPDAPRDFDGLANYFTTRDIEGIVWHHPDGRMAKIKGRDFGVKRPR